MTRESVALVGLTLAFVAFAVVAKLDPRDAIDRDVADAVRATTALDPLWRAASWPGQLPWGVVVSVVAFAGLLFVSRRDAVALAIAVIGVEAIGELTRLVIDRPRPGDEAIHANAGALSSFPSGHVTLYVALFGCLAIAARARIRARAPRVAVVAVLVALIAIIGPSRVYLGAHWPSDVAGSYALGGAWLVIAVRIAHALAARTRSASHV